MIWALALLLPGILAQTCPPGGVFNTQYNKCFNIYSTGAQYSIAEQNCMNIGGHLVSVTNAFENSIIVDNAKNQLSSSNSSDFWIGANDLVSKGNWAWTDASNFVYNNWAAGQPSPSNDCATASLSNGQWNTVDCYQYRPYACASPPMGSPTCPPPPTCPTLYCPTSACTQRTCKPSCPSEWTYFGPTDSCYKSFFHSKWADAEDFCVQQGSHLASIHSQEENTFVARMTTTQLKETNPDDLTWIGLHKDGNSWVWTDGSKVDYINWAPKQPDNAGKENCVEIAQDKSHDGWFENWNNEKCDEMLRAFVCKTASSH